jgi:hypothetical protein
MGTKLRRLQVALPDSLSEALSDLADAQARPVSKVIVALLAEMEPQIRDLTTYAKCVKAGKMNEAKQALVHMFGNNLAEILHDQEPPKRAQKGAKP